MEPLTIVLIILAFTILAFMSGKLPFSVISMGIIIALIQTKVLTVTEAFSALTNNNVIMLAAMFVLGAGIIKSGLLEGTNGMIMRYQDRPRVVLLILMLVAAGMSILTSAVGTLAILLPLLISVANHLNVSRSKIIFPVAAVANISTASTFLGQGAANASWNDVMLNMGAATPFGIWDFTIARIPIIIIAILYGIFIAPKLLPDIPSSSFDTVAAAAKGDKSIPQGKKKLAKFICAATILAMIVLDYFNLMPMYLTACYGAVLLVVCHVLTESEALSSIHGPTLFLFIGVLPLSDALKITGAADVVAEKMLLLLGNTTNPYVIMAVFFIVPLILTQVMSNIATIFVFIPLVASVSMSIGVDPRAGVMAVIVASCVSILTPMSCAAQAMIMAPGGYKLKDYLKCGLPLAAVCTVICIFLFPLLFPFW